LSFTLQGVRAGSVAKYKGAFRGWDELTFLHAHWPKIAMAGGSGYIKGYPGNNGEMTLSITMPNSTQAHLKTIVDPIIQRMHRRSVNVNNGSIEDDGSQGTQIVGRYTEYKSIHEAMRDMSAAEIQHAEQATFPGIGENKIITSWLWGSAEVSSPRLKQVLRSAVDGETQFLNDATLGIGSQKPPYIRGGGNAVNPAFRTAVMRPAAELQWDGTDLRKLARRKQDAQRFGAALRSLNPKGGTYANEADPDTPDWQHAFWGSNYERLLQIKQMVDPEGVFYCRACVGSELFEDRSGVLCRK
jgi:hypothetical protein